MKCRLLIASLLAALFTVAASAQTQYTVGIAGNSLAEFQMGFQPYEFQPTLAPYVQILGIKGAECSTFLATNQQGQQLILFYVPASAQVAVLIESTNDAKDRLVTLASHMNCMNTTISLLQARNPDLRVIVVNTPPFTQDNCYGDFRTQIALYNAAYSDPTIGFAANHPHTKVADVWTPAVQPDGWAYPQYMQGPCGIHPGDEQVWSASWAHFAQGYEGLVLSGLAKQW